MLSHSPTSPSRRARCRRRRAAGEKSMSGGGGGDTRAYGVHIYVEVYVRV